MLDRTIKMMDFKQILFQKLKSNNLSEPNQIS